MKAPLFTAEELESWKQRERDAKVPRPDDNVFHPDSPRPYNESAWVRAKAVQVAMSIERYRRIRLRPENILDALTVAFYEKGTLPLIWDDIWEGGLGDRLVGADSPDTRRWLHTVLQGLRAVPRSWATSATTKFFRGIGKQGEAPWSSKPGAGILSKDYGWTTDAAAWFVGLFYKYPLDKLFFSDDSPDPYGDEGREIADEGGERFAATRKDRDDAFFDALLKILEDRGLGDMPDAQVKVPKPHKARAWTVGDKITSRNIRDVPEGAYIEWRLVMPEGGGPYREGDFQYVHNTYGLVFGTRNAGRVDVRPVVKGTAFGWQGMASSSLYKVMSYRYAEAEAIYQGMWKGPVLDVEINDKAWKALRTQIVKMRTVRVEEDGKFVRWETNPV